MARVFLVVGLPALAVAGLVAWFLFMPSSCPACEARRQRILGWLRK